MLETSQSAFSRALLNPDIPTPQGLTSWNGKGVDSRFGVYRNNVFVGLIDALAARFPVCQKLVGEDFFRAMAWDFVRVQPPSSPLLMFYGEAFPDYIDGFDAAGSVAFLSDMARFEYARGLAYHAKDAAVLEPAHLSAVSPDLWGACRFTVHPAVKILRSRFAILSIWEAHQGTHDLRAVEVDEAQDVVIVRPELAVSAWLLPPGGAYFLQSLQQGEALNRAVQKGATVPGFDLTACLALFLGQGVFQSFELIQEERS